MIKIYDVGTDELRDATQADVDQLQRGCSKLAKKNSIIKAVANLNVLVDEEILKQIANILKV